MHALSVEVLDQVGGEDAIELTAMGGKVAHGVRSLGSQTLGAHELHHVVIGVHADTCNVAFSEKLEELAPPASDVEHPRTGGKALGVQPVAVFQHLAAVAHELVVVAL